VRQSLPLSARKICSENDRGGQFKVQLAQELSDLHCVTTAASESRRPQLAAIRHGTGWILFEQAADRPARSLLSVLSPRRTARDVAAYAEQLYVDRFCSIRAQLTYKKSRKYALYPATIGRYGLSVQCGREPLFLAVLARNILLKGQVLEYEYRVVVHADDPPHVLLETRRQSLMIDA
jgi:hypothetical protein